MTTITLHTVRVTQSDLHNALRLVARAIDVTQDASQALVCLYRVDRWITISAHRETAHAAIQDPTDAHA